MTPLSDLLYARYTLPLSRPLTVGPASSVLRQGALLKATTGALADIAPLPGLSSSSLNDEIASLASPSSSLAAASWARWALAHYPVRSHELGTRQRAVETAQLVRIGDVPPPSDRPLTLKVKVGRGPLREEIDGIKTLAAQGHLLRLDGNRKLTLRDTDALAGAAGTQLEFFEEPVAAIDAASAAAVWPIALDETLAESMDRARALTAAAWVLKPTLLGARKTLQLVELAKASQTSIVISSCFESAVGRCALAKAAQAWAPHIAHGLGTAAWFSVDLDHPGAIDDLSFLKVVG